MDPQFDQKFETLKQQHADGCVVGLGGITGKPVARKDIDVLMRDEPKTFNLFILALKRLQDIDANQIMSFYQIAGIHGYPKVLWNNVGGKNKDLRINSGYCAHSKTTFPTWHRPYLVMLEQAIFVEMVNIARQYDSQYRQDYLLAATKFRLPYWDYYRPRGGPVTFSGVIDGGKTSAPFDYSVPKIFTEADVTVRVPPQNTPTRLGGNPFQHFNFKSELNATISENDWKAHEDAIRSGGRTPALSHRRTARHVRPGDSTFESENQSQLNNVLNELRMDNNRYTLAMIGEDYYNNYDNFSCNIQVSEDQWVLGKPKGPFTPIAGDDHVALQKKAWSSSGSIEGLHNSYHGLCGWNGHLGDVAVAAFDPLFWFHHNNIERIFTVWQAVHAKDALNWFSQSGEASAKLIPFYQSKGNFWISNTIKDSKTLGYTYDEVKETPEQTRTNFINMYQWSVPTRRSSDWGPCPTEMTPFDALNKSEFFKPPTSLSARTATASVATAQPVTSTEAEAPAQPFAAVKHMRVSQHAAPAAPATAAPALTPILESRIEDQLAPTPQIGKDEKTYDWYIDDSVERMALNGSFAIMYFINMEPGRRFDDTQNMIVAPTLAGITYIFTLPTESCESCEQHEKDRSLVSNTVPITAQLLDFVAIGQLQDLSPANVGPFLIDRLRWRIVKADGGIVDSRMMSNEKQLRIGISTVRHTGVPIAGPATPEVIRYDDIIPRIIGLAPTTTAAGPAPTQ